MPLDVNGIWQYTGPELAAPADDLLNRLGGSTSTQVAALREKTVRTFASAAARASEVPTPLEGALTWLEDVNRLEVFTGSSWLAVPATKPFTHVVPAAVIAGTTVPMTPDADFAYEHQGQRVIGAVSFTVSAPTVSGAWEVVLPVPVRFLSSYRLTIGTGWFTNGGSLILCSLVVIPASPSRALLFTQGGSYSGYVAGAVAGASVSATVAYESTAVSP